MSNVDLIESDLAERAMHISTSLLVVGVFPFKFELCNRSAEAVKIQPQREKAREDRV